MQFMLLGLTVVMFSALGTIGTPRPPDRVGRMVPAGGTAPEVALWWERRDAFLLEKIIEVN